MVSAKFVATERLFAIPVGYALETPEKCEYAHLAEHLIGHAIARQLVDRNTIDFRVDAATGPFETWIGRPSSQPPAQSMNLSELLYLAYDLPDEIKAFETEMLQFENQMLWAVDPSASHVPVGISALKRLSGCSATDAVDLDFSDANRALEKLDQEINASAETQVFAKSYFLPAIVTSYSDMIETKIVAFAFRFSSNTDERADEIVAAVGRSLENHKGRTEVHFQQFNNDGFVAMFKPDQDTSDRDFFVKMRRLVITALASARRQTSISEGWEWPEALEGTNIHWGGVERFKLPAPSHVKSRETCLEFDSLMQDKSRGLDIMSQRLRNYFRFEARVAFDASIEQTARGTEVCTIGLSESKSVSSAPIQEIISSDRSN